MLDTRHDECGTFKGAVLEFELQTFGQTGGPWCSADWFSPNSIAIDSDGTVLVATTVQGGTAELYRIDRTTGGVSPVGDLTGTFIAAQLTVAQDGRIFLTDWSGPSGCLRADVKDVNGGTGATSSLGCNGEMWFPNGILEGPSGHLFIADRDSQICDSGGQTNSGTVWRVSSTTIAEVTHYCHADSFNPHEIAWYPVPFDIFADGFESGNVTAWSGMN